MPAKEIKELRKSGNLTDAYAMARAELLAEPDNIWTKRNMSWVLYSQLDIAAVNLAEFLNKIEELKQLQLPDTEVMFFENMSIIIAKATRIITKEANIDHNKIHRLFDAIKELPLVRNVKWFSILYGALHKGMKDSNRYLEFADWWNFENFKPEDFLKEKMPNGKEVMAIAEQAYIAYAKHLLTLPTILFDDIEMVKNKVDGFLPKITRIIDAYPDYQYPAYFKAKLLLKKGGNDNILPELLPFAKKKQNEFWVWDILAEAFANDSEKVFACYCRALSCSNPEEMLVNLRQRMAKIFISKNLYNEAKTEIELGVKAREMNGWKLPSEILNWQSQEWYKNALGQQSNKYFYKQYLGLADSLLFSDIPEETIFVDFVNTQKKILNFIASETKFGFFKYDRFLQHVKIGDILKVRFQQGSEEGRYKIYTAFKIDDDIFKVKFYKEVEGDIRITEGKAFGFLGDIYIHPSIIEKGKLTNGTHLKGIAIKSYNREKKQWSWRFVG